MSGKETRALLFLVFSLFFFFDVCLRLVKTTKWLVSMKGFLENVEVASTKQMPKRLTNAVQYNMDFLPNRSSNLRFRLPECNPPSSPSLR